MPTEEIPSLDSEQISRLMAMATSGKISSKVHSENNELLQEINLDFARTMNKIIFDKHINLSGKELITKSLQMPPPPPDKIIPFHGMFKIPQHDFPEQFSNFCFHSLYIKEEVIESMTKIKEECNKVINELSIYNT